MKYFINDDVGGGAATPTHNEHRQKVAAATAAKRRERTASTTPPPPTPSPPIPLNRAPGTIAARLPHTTIHGAGAVGTVGSLCAVPTLRRPSAMRYSLHSARTVYL